jgi:hypothetical protein
MKFDEKIEFDEIEIIELVGSNVINNITPDLNLNE